MAKRQFRTVYRDRLTGKFVSKKFAKANPRARTGGRKRYKKERIRIAPPPGTEYIMRVKSAALKRANEPPAEIHVFGPAGAKDEDVMDAVLSWAMDQPLQPGWSMPIGISWRGKVYPPSDERLREAISQIFQNLDYTITPAKGNSDRGSGDDT